MARIVDTLVDRFFGSAVRKAIDRVAREKHSQEIRRGLQDRYQEHASDGQESESPADELLDRYALQPTLRAAVDKVARIVSDCHYEIALRDGEAEVPEQRKYLESLLDHPNGRDPFTLTLFESVVRLKVVGEAHWEWIYPDEATLDASRPTVTKALLSGLLTTERRKGGEITPERAKALATRAVKAAGDAIERKKRLPLGFRILQGTVNPIVDQHGDFKDPEKAFVQIVTTGRRAYFALGDVLWIKGPNPRGGSHALAPFESLRYTDDIDQMVQVYKSSFLRNRSTPDGMLTVKNPARGELERVRLELDTRHKGPEHAGKTYVVGVDGEGGTDYKAMGSKPLELEHAEEPKWRREQMLAVTNVPGGKLGYTDSVNRSNMEQQDKSLLEEEVQPLADLIADAFNQFVQVTLGFTAYELRFSQADLRTESAKLDNGRKRLELGLDTVNTLLAAEHGEKAKVEGGDLRFVRVHGHVLVFAETGEPLLLTSTGAVPLIAPPPPALAPSEKPPAEAEHDAEVDPGQKTVRKTLLQQLREARGAR